MKIITLTSDWGTKDHYLAQVKGRILKEIPDAVIIDISHQIPPFDLNQASFIFRNSWKSFPEGTIHIIDLMSDASIKTPHALVMLDDQYFIGTDNGFFSLVFDAVPKAIYEIDILQDSDYFTFSARDVFIKAAAHIASGQLPENLGHPIPKLVPRIPFAPVIEANLLIGHVIYVDNYENVITNISEKVFREVGKNRPFTIMFGSSKYFFKQLNTSYKDVPETDVVVLINASGLLEIAISLGNASGLLGLDVEDNIRIEFKG